MSSYKRITPDEDYVIEGEIPEISIKIPLKVDKDVLAQTKMPIIVKVVHKKTLLARIHAYVESLEPTTLADVPEGAKQRTLDAEIKWTDDEEQVDVRDWVGTILQYLSSPKVAWVKKWENENARI